MLYQELREQSQATAMPEDEFCRMDALFGEGYSSDTLR